MIRGRPERNLQGYVLGIALGGLVLTGLASRNNQTALFDHEGRSIDAQVLSSDFLGDIKDLHKERNYVSFTRNGIHFQIADFDGDDKPDAIRLSQGETVVFASRAPDAKGNNHINKYAGELYRSLR